MGHVHICAVRFFFFGTGQRQIVFLVPKISIEMQRKSIKNTVLSFDAFLLYFHWFLLQDKRHLPKKAKRITNAKCTQKTHELQPT